MTTLLEWLVTYLIHSTLLLGVAWLADRPLAGRPHLQELMWKVALVGGILTATAQTTSALKPWGGTWNLAVDPPLVTLTEAAATTSASGDLAPSEAESPVADSRRDGVFMAEADTSFDTVASFSTSRVEAGSAVSPPALKATAEPAAVMGFTRSSLPSLIVGAWAVGALILLGLLGRAWLSLRRQLRHRHTLESQPIKAILSALASRSPEVAAPRLSVSPKVVVPMAMGLLRPEICLSERVVWELSRQAQEGLLAHELGHLVRRDPLFRLLANVIGRVFFFQPLNWLAARRLSACAELLSDDWAARRTAEPLALAECLTTVARWTVGPVRGLPAAASVTGPSDLKQRIERLLRGEGLSSGSLRPAWAGPLASFALTALTLLAPTACGGARASGRHSNTPDRAHAHELPPDAHIILTAKGDDDAEELYCYRAPSDEQEDAAEERDGRRRGKTGRAPAPSPGRGAHAHRAPKVHDDDGDDDDDNDHEEAEAPQNDPDDSKAHEPDGDDDEDDERDSSNAGRGPKPLEPGHEFNASLLDDDLKRLEKTIDSMNDAIPSPESLKAFLGKVWAKTGKQPENRAEVERDLAQAKREMHEQLARAKEQMKRSLRKDMAKAMKTRRETESDRRGVERGQREAEERRHEMEAVRREIERKVEEARERAREAKERARERIRESFGADPKKP